MAVTDESHKIKHHLDGLRGHAESCALTSPRMFIAAIHALVCFCCQGTLAAAKKKKVAAAKKAAKRKAKARRRRNKWVLHGSPAHNSGNHSLSTNVDTAHYYLRNMKLYRIRTILGRNAACMCFWSLAIGTSANIYFRACARCASLVRSGWKSITWLTLLSVAFIFSRLEREVFPFPCPESLIQLQLSYNGYLTYLMFAARNLPLDSSLKFSICCSS